MSVRRVIFVLVLMVLALQQMFSTIEENKATTLCDVMMRGILM